MHTCSLLCMSKNHLKPFSSFRIVVLTSCKYTSYFVLFLRLLQLIRLSSLIRAMLIFLIVVFEISNTLINKTPVARKSHCRFLPYYWFLPYEYRVVDCILISSTSAALFWIHEQVFSNLIIKVNDWYGVKKIIDLLFFWAIIVLHSDLSSKFFYS